MLACVFIVAKLLALIEPDASNNRATLRPHTAGSDGLMRRLANRPEFHSQSLSLLVSPSLLGIVVVPPEVTLTVNVPFVLLV